MNDDFKEAMDDARYLREKQVTLPPADECPSDTEDYSDIESTRDKHGRLVVSQNGKVIYVEGLFDARQVVPTSCRTTKRKQGAPND